jgi:benzoyl-CoA reductase/2-hydroxyglutaryl-CoA dehydratase subunit BcrC/BadD/HgdB
MESKITYPEEYKDEFLKSGDLHLSNGKVVRPEEIWDFLTREAPEKYPFAFERQKAFFGMTVSDDFGLPAALKSNYLALTLSDRMEELVKNGGHVAYVQGGQAVDPYTAAGFVGLRPALIGAWARGKIKGKTTTQEELGRKEDKERGYKNISFEACQTAGYEHIQEGDLQVDFVAPYSALRCSDISYGLEAHRHGRRANDVSLFLGDYPMRHQAEKEWAVDYFAVNLRKLVKEMDRISGRTTTEEDLRNTIKMHNKARKMSMELADIWWNAPEPPTNGMDRSNLFILGNLEIHGDPVADMDILTEALDSVRYRAQNRIRSPHIAENAKRLFVCGSCITLDNYRTEDRDGIVVGTDNAWSHASLLVEEEGDPYYNLAKTTLSYPYEQSIKERAAWTIEQVKKSRADGLLFLYNWGCNTQSAVARAVCDEVKEKTDLPTMVMENELIGLTPEQQHNRVAAFIEMVG